MERKTREKWSRLWEDFTTALTPLNVFVAVALGSLAAAL